MYGNLYKVGGTEIEDVKFYDNPTYNLKSSNVSEDSIFVSTQDQSFNKLYETKFKDILSQPSNVEA
jgi:hypothetical protein